MKHKAKKHRAKKHRRIRAKFDEMVVSLGISTSGDRIVKTGDVDSNGNIDARQGDMITFEYNTGTRTFALLIIRFTPASGSGNPKESPFDAKVYITDDGSMSKRVKGNAKKGRYEYRLALLDGAGDLVTHDPQIIVQ